MSIENTIVTLQASADRAIAKINQLKAEVARLSLRWTTEQPTKPGDYYFRPFKGDMPGREGHYRTIRPCPAGATKVIVRVWLDNDSDLLGWVHGYPFAPLHLFYGEWAGPFSEPIEQQKQEPQS